MGSDTGERNKDPERVMKTFSHEQLYGGSLP